MADKKKWEIELERYLKNKISRILNIDDDDDVEGLEIKILNIEDLFDYNNITDDTTIDDLAMYYAFTIMSEEFEKSNIIKNELNERDCTLDLIVNDDTAILNVYHLDNNEVPYVDVKFNVTSEGLIIDFEEEDF